jgi:uncharacterized protein YggE
MRVCTLSGWSGIGVVDIIRGRRAIGFLSTRPAHWPALRTSNIQARFTKLIRTANSLSEKSEMTFTSVIAALLAFSSIEAPPVQRTNILAQTSGNVAYSDQKRQRPRELALGNIAGDDSAMFLEAHILLNAKADHHVAVFGASQEGRTVQECNQKLDAQINSFTSQLRALGIRNEDVVVDYVAQNRIYDYEVSGDTATEKLTGFEVKKNILVPYKERGGLDQLLVAAARSNIFDLIKVDYVVDNVAAVRARLLDEAARTIKEKADRYTRLFGVKFRSPVQVYLEKYDTVFPTEAYDSYTAFETGKVMANYYNQHYKVAEARKNRTFYFNPRDGGEFDLVINPVVTEPIVQFSLYLRVKHLIDRW